MTPGRHLLTPCFVFRWDVTAEEMETLLAAPRKTQLIFLNHILGFLGWSPHFLTSSAELIQVTNPGEESHSVLRQFIPVPQTLTSPLPPSHSYRGLTLVLTFLSYTSYHLSRKPISIVKVSSSLSTAVGTGNLEGEHGEGGADSSTLISPPLSLPAEPAAPQLLGLGPKPPQ